MAAVHDYVGEPRLPIVPRMAYDEDRSRLLIEHFDVTIRAGDTIRLGEDIVERRTYRVLTNRRKLQGVWLAELQAEPPRQYIAGTIVG